MAKMEERDINSPHSTSEFVESLVSVVIHIRYARPRYSIQCCEPEEDVLPSNNSMDSHPRSVSVHAG